MCHHFIGHFGDVLSIDELHDLHGQIGHQSLRLGLIVDIDQMHGSLLDHRLQQTEVFAAVFFMHK